MLGALRWLAAEEIAALHARKEKLLIWIIYPDGLQPTAVESDGLESENSVLRRLNVLQPWSGEWTNIENVHS